jgi:hypothetical protein
VVFAAVTVLGGLIGALAYLAVGRPMLEAESREASAVSGNEAARRRALDQLYGPPPDQRK